MNLFNNLLHKESSSFRASCAKRGAARNLSSFHAQRGFTLIELLIVISIILILVGIAAGNYQRSILRSKETVLKQDLQEIRKAIDNYTMDKQAAPQTIDDLAPQYLHAIPVDPVTNAKDWVPVVDNVVLTPDQSSSGVTDVHSASEKVSPFEGTAYSSW